MEDIGYDQVQDWFDPQVVKDYEQVPMREEEFRFELTVAQVEPVYIIKPEKEGPIIVMVRGELGPEILTLLMDLDAERRNVQTLFTSVLTNAPGEYGYLDENQDPCGFEDIQYLELQHRIYPDEASQHKLMTTIVDLRMAILFIQQMVEITKADIGGNR